jgi:hypothetical protein
MSNAVVKGSLSSVSRSTGASLAESFLNVDALILVDISLSMNQEDVLREGLKVSRWSEAKRQLEMLQATLPGRIALVAFSYLPSFCPDGNLPAAQSSTNMLAALKFIKVVDGCNIKLILISDGAPNEIKSTLNFASTFVSHIDTIHIGSPKDETGKKFLRDLAALTGGIVVESSSQVLPKLSGSIQRLIGA